MKYVFIINPVAGKGGGQEALQREIQAFFAPGEYEIHRTTGPGEATEFVSRYPAGEACFVACGGDGTLNEVVSGLVGREPPLFAVMPLGSGNDFARMFGELPAFLSLAALREGRAHPIDLIDCGGRYAVNLCNLGFDADVVRNALPIKRFPFVSGPMAYILSVVRTLFGKIARPLAVTLDGEEKWERDTLLCVMANGQYCGGGFWCSPKARIGDGKLDFVGVSKVSRLTFARLVTAYRAGRHLIEPRFASIVTYRRAEEIHVECGEEFTVCVDGEVLRTRSFTARVLPGALSLLAPKGVSLEPLGERPGAVV